MRRQPYRCVRPGISAGLALCASLFATSPASAHVKWFCSFNVAGPPRALDDVVGTDFAALSGLALAVLLIAAFVERTPFGLSLLRALNRVTGRSEPGAELLIRAVCAFFFVSLWNLGGVFLTPELATTFGFVPPLQLAIAAGLVSRRTMPLSAAGIALLFGLATWQYGLFHMMDYPIFLGVAAYLVLTAQQRTLFGLRPLDVVRWAAGITLMWASIEKWAYPQWSFPLFAVHPEMTLGYSDEFFMRAAGVIEFTLAFALIWTPLVRRAAAIMLAGTFISAIAEFGKVDAIGHSAIIAVLLAIAADQGSPARAKQHPLAAPLAYGAALGGVLAVYYFAHAALFGTAIT